MTHGKSAPAIGAGAGGVEGCCREGTEGWGVIEWVEEYVAVRSL